MSNRIDTTRLQEIARAYTASAVLYAALDVGLFTQVSGGCRTEEALVDATGLRPIDVDRLVSCALSLGFLIGMAQSFAMRPTLRLIWSKERNDTQVPG
ncbi:MAG: hypothetical protein Ct9H300mP26_4680 [Acidimicrobiales bacterium]|nr:MAG: hypothetical protein Ct9H300mP26_4680 [Acidimicrobiales bacterium]